MSSTVVRGKLHTALALVALPVLACTSGNLGDPVPALRCTPPAELGPTAVGEKHTVEVVCAVGARSGVEIIAAQATGPFSTTAPGGTWRPSGTLPIAITFKPVVAGTFEGQVVLAYRVGGTDQREETFSVRGVAEGHTAWSPVPEPPPCRADVAAAPLLDLALELAGLDRASFTMADLSAVEILNDPFRLSWFAGVRAAPHRAGCFEGEVVGALDAYLASPHPVSGAIRHAAALLDRPVGEPAMTASARLVAFDTALEQLCTGPAGPCDVPSGEIPAELAKALAPVLVAIDEGLSARAEMAAGDKNRTPAFWYESGGNHVLGGDVYPGPADQTYLLGKTGRQKLYGAAARIAYAVETADLARWAGAADLRYDVKTAAGWIRLRDAADDVYDDDGTATLLLLDTGGNDVHRDPAGANRDEANPVSVLIDLAGDDFYGYAVVPDPNDREGVLPSDAEGRDTSTAVRVGASRSTRSRQGAARNGIAMLFDLGGGNDRYESLVGSQGYAHQGVGVLFDDGGDDVYLAESASQGAGVFGIGLLLDAGAGRDERRSITHSQGFGYVAGTGFLFDGGGNDVYFCDGGAAGGGLTVYPSEQDLSASRFGQGTERFSDTRFAQEAATSLGSAFRASLPTEGNNSFCQGAGLGMLGDTGRPFLSGGIGILRDVDGNDTYTGSVFAQGAGYWQGTGVLSDGDGDDQYEAFRYVQGAAAHFAVGILADAGAGDDTFRPRDAGLARASLGASHDLSLGVLISEGGNDEYHLGTLAGGASSCGGVGLFVDNGGDDRYVAFSDYGSGLADVGGECIDVCGGCIADRNDLFGIGIMIDGGGNDVYEYPPSVHKVPAEGSTWGRGHGDLPSEHGAGIDGTGETGIHAESEVR